jgi:hypothetical protein
MEQCDGSSYFSEGTTFLLIAAYVLQGVQIADVLEIH